MKDFAKRLKDLRNERGYTQEELAKLLNTSRSTIGMYEQGKREPNFEMQEAIADLFNVNMDYLLKRDIDKEEMILIERYREASPETRKHILAYMQFLTTQK